MPNLSDLPPTEGEAIPADPFPDDRDKWEAWCWLVKGAAEALSVRLVAHTNGPEMGMVNLDADTAPPTVERDAITHPPDLVRAFRCRIQLIGVWGPDSDTWGPDPWDAGQDVRRHP